MWDRKSLKQQAKKMLRHQYITMIAVCFLLAFVAGEYGDTLASVRYYNTSMEEESVEGSKLEESTEQMGAGEDTKPREHSLSMPHGEKAVEPNSRGVFAKILQNTNANGSFFAGVIHTLLPLSDNSQGIQILLSFAGLAFAFLWWFFVQNVLLVGEARFFLEKINYKEVPFKTLLLPIRAGKWVNTAAAMGLKNLYEILWWLTIVGGPVKYYSYLMVPYILAENPGISPREAVRLSVRMMKGEKWRTFILDLSFVGWSLLGAFTLGLLDIFFLNPYMACVHAQLYRSLRGKAIEEKIKGCEFLNDRRLFEVPEGENVSREDGYAYPIASFPVQAHRRVSWLHIDYMRTYSLSNLILLFFTFSVLGWAWEVALHIVEDGIFVNRGTMYGPWLPIYGSGGVLILVLLSKIRRNPVLTFGMTVVLCGVLEYVTSWALEVSKGMKWWDYSGYFLNLNGRICAEGLFVFGIGGCAFIYILAPLLTGLFDRLPSHRKTLICILLVVMFATDFSYSVKHPNAGRGITDYESRLDTGEYSVEEMFRA